jgi:hypothetical protein
VLGAGEVGRVFAAGEREDANVVVPEEREPGDERVVLVLGAGADEEDAGGAPSERGAGVGGCPGASCGPANRARVVSSARRERRVRADMTGAR